MNYHQNKPKGSSSVEDAEGFKKLVADIENSKETSDEIITSEQPDKAWENFKSNYKIIEAAGGVVSNNQNEVLFIFRLGNWDLPKGKIEEGEKIKEAAIREVEEECGIEDLEIVRQLPDTYHTYTLNGQDILKRTYWFEMKTNYKGELTPQLEEDITEVKWVPKELVGSYMSNTYNSINWLLSCYLESSIS